MDNKIVANIKTLSIDMITNASSGHPGIVLSATPILYTLYKYHLNINPKDPNWYARDRFIMSAGHGSAALYSTLYMAGFDITLDDLKKFRQLDSITPGHPEYRTTPGVECSTGPLGQGVATAIGMALGAKILKTRFQKVNKNDNPFDFNTYVLVGDGDLMEGVSYEALSLAGTLNLDNLIILYDSNNTTLDGSTDITFKEDVQARFKAMGFDTYKVKDGNNINELNDAITKAKKSKKPTFIEIKTHLGYGSLLQDDHKVHGSVLLDDDIKQLKEKLKMPLDSFYVDNSLKEDMNSFIAKRVGDRYLKTLDIKDKEILTNLDTKYQDLKFYFDKNIKYDISTINWENEQFNSIRDTNKYVLNEVARNIPEILVGSADLNSSTKVYLDNEKDIKPNDFDGRNIWYGIREHAMGAISNGLALLNFIPVSSTFLVFSDYLKPAIRMSALMNLNVIYTFTHDSVSIGQDGPTHQPVEQLSTLRSIPNLDVYRPADLKEIIGTYQAILNSKRPSAIVISRSKEVRLDNTSASKTMKGGYVIKNSKDAIATLVATGKEVELALKISLALSTKNINLRVVSIPSLELFERQKKEYKDSVLKSLPIIVIEAGSYFGWGRITDYNNIIGIDQFGISAKGEDVLKRLKFSEEEILNKILKIIKK